MTVKPSWQLGILDLIVRRLVRRESWGDERSLVKRARRLFGSPPLWASVASIGVRVESVNNEGVCGEWIIPKNPSPGVIFYIHGGGYVACSPRTHRPVTATLARMTRCRVFSVAYRRAPESRFPAALDDVTSAYRWLLTAPGDSEPVAIGGDSAGGGLALALLVAIRDGGLTAPRCAVLASPWTDLSGSGESVTGNAGRCAMFAPANIQEFAGTYLGGADATDPRASPLFADLSRLPPMLIQVGDTELLLDDSKRINEKVLASAGKSTLEEWPRVFHGWQMLAGIAPEADAALRRFAEFVAGHMQPAAGETSVAGASESNSRNMQFAQEIS